MCSKSEYDWNLEAFARPSLVSNTLVHIHIVKYFTGNGHKRKSMLYFVWSAQRIPLHQIIYMALQQWMMPASACAINYIIFGHCMLCDMRCSDVQRPFTQTHTHSVRQWRTGIYWRSIYNLLFFYDSHFMARNENAQTYHIQLEVCNECEKYLECIRPFCRFH